MKAGSCARGDRIAAGGLDDLLRGGGIGVHRRLELAGRGDDALGTREGGVLVDCPGQGVEMLLEVAQRLLAGGVAAAEQRAEHIRAHRVVHHVGFHMVLEEVRRDRLFGDGGIFLRHDEEAGPSGKGGDADQNGGGLRRGFVQRRDLHEKSPARKPPRRPPPSQL